MCEGGTGGSLTVAGEGACWGEVEKCWCLQQLCPLSRRPQAETKVKRLVKGRSSETVPSSAWPAATGCRAPGGAVARHTAAWCARQPVEAAPGLPAPLQGAVGLPHLRSLAIDGRP